MSPGPLERRYRLLLRLMPAEHRAARGAELLGLLLDLDEGRTSPSPRQAAGLVALALRLRLAGPASLLIAAFLIACAAEISETLYNLGTGRVSVIIDSGFPVHNVVVALLIPAGLRLAVAVAWILGSRRVLPALFAAQLAYAFATAGLGSLTVVDLGVMVVVGAALALRCPAPRPRVVLLAAIPLAMELWPLVAAYSLGYGTVTAVVTVLGALLSRRPVTSRRRAASSPEPGSAV